MNPQNFISPRVPQMKRVDYTDGTPSREVEDEEEMDKFKKGFAYKKPSIMNVRDEINNLICLIDVASSSLMAPHPYIDPTRVHCVLSVQVIGKLKELEQELTQL